MRILLIQLDGKMPNLALMRLGAHHKASGDQVELRQARRPDSSAFEVGLWDSFDRVYASTIFTKTAAVVRRLREVYPAAIVGGTGVDRGKPAADRMTLERLGITSAEQDYGLYPSFAASIGYTQRGCRLNCGFCDVPLAEGKVTKAARVHDIWRGQPWPKHLILLDNDFFGQTDWRAEIEAIRDGGFKVSLTQGINARLLSDEAAEAIASIDYYNDSFSRRCIHTAWDSLGDDGPLFRGLHALVRHGVKPYEITVYMLIEYGTPLEDWEERRRRLREFGAMPYPMPYLRTPGARGFQRWCLGGYDRPERRHYIPWDVFERAGYEPRNVNNTDYQLTPN
jgi:hypothetical protein